MELTYLEKAIYKEIKKIRKIRWADLKRMIVDEKKIVLIENALFVKNIIFRIRLPFQLF